MGKTWAKVRSVSRTRYSFDMRKTLVALLVALLSASFIAPAQAAPKASLVTTAFKTLLNTTSDSLDSLDQKYEADVLVTEEGCINLSENIPHHPDEIEVWMASLR